MAQNLTRKSLAALLRERELEVGQENGGPDASDDEGDPVPGHRRP